MSFSCCGFVCFVCLVTMCETAGVHVSQCCSVWACSAIRAWSSCSSTESAASSYLYHLFLQQGYSVSCFLDSVVSVCSLYSILSVKVQCESQSDVSSSSEPYSCIKNTSMSHTAVPSSSRTRSILLPQIQNRPSNVDSSSAENSPQHRKTKMNLQTCELHLKIHVFSGEQWALSWEPQAGRCSIMFS